MSKFRTRRFLPADETRFHGFSRVRPRRNRFRGPRSLELTRWLWYQAPGGPVDSWIIEAEQADGAWKIVGHHGLCPVRFTLGDQDLLCGKTFNTILLPEFRSKFLYLRFEQECLQEAENRFDATYSGAPGTARLRKALGYKVNSTWLHMVRGLQAPETLARFVGLLARRYRYKAWNQIAHSIARVSGLGERKPLLELTQFTSEEAPQSPFFADFWREARLHAGMSPRRDIADLSWRFWKRPNSTYSTLTCTWKGGARGYCIVNTTDPCTYCLEDIFITPQRPEMLDALLDAVFAWCAQRGALLLSFFTTTDGQPPALMEVFLRRMHQAPLRRFFRPGEFPRRLSTQGKSRIGEKTAAWNATCLLIPA